MMLDNSLPASVASPDIAVYVQSTAARIVVHATNVKKVTLNYIGNGVSDTETYTNLKPDLPSVTVHDLKPETEYTFEVKLENLSGQESLWSQRKTVSTLPGIFKAILPNLTVTIVPAFNLKDVDAMLAEIANVREFIGKYNLMDRFPEVDEFPSVAEMLSKFHFLNIVLLGPGNILS